MLPIPEEKVISLLNPVTTLGCLDLDYAFVQFVRLAGSVIFDSAADSRALVRIARSTGDSMLLAFFLSTQITISLAIAWRASYRFSGKRFAGNA